MRRSWGYARLDVGGGGRGGSDSVAGVALGDDLAARVDDAARRFVLRSQLGGGCFFPRSLARGSDANALRRFLRGAAATVAGGGGAVGRVALRRPSSGMEIVQHGLVQRAQLECAFFSVTSL